jgi:hypothetical protein
MKLCITYTLSFLKKLPDGFGRQLRLHLEGKTFQIIDWEENKNQATAIVECPVKREGLSIHTGREPFDGSAPEKGILVPEQADLSRFLTRVIDILLFLTDVPIRYARKLANPLIPETPDDEHFLKSLGTRKVYAVNTVRHTIRSFSLPIVDNHTLESLVSKELGLALYAQALFLSEPIAAFREFWKVLESAFGEYDRQLIGYLADFAPAQDMGFTRDEIKDLYELRGSASHAASKSGIEQHRSDFNETSHRLPRLKCLVEQVILTKKTWGIRTLQTERLAPIAAYIDPDDVVVLIRRK